MLRRGSCSRGGNHSGRGGGRGLFLVRVRVFDHPVFPNEPFAADITGERLLAGVEAHVPSKIRLVVELLGAHLTLVWLVARVLGQVLLNYET